MIKVQVLSTPGCVSCASAKKMLEKIGQETPIQIEEINVLGRPDLLEKYRFMAMPGIVIDGKLEFSGLPTEIELRQKLIKNEKNKASK